MLAIYEGIKLFEAERVGSGLAECRSSESLLLYYAQGILRSEDSAAKKQDVNLFLFSWNAAPAWWLSE